MVLCEGQKDREWLGKSVPRLNPWEGDGLATCEASKLPRLVKMMIYVPGSKTPEEVMKHLARQNANLQVVNWRVNGSKEVEDGKTKKKETAVWVDMEKGEAESLKRVNYRPFFGLGRAHCVP